MIFLLAGAVTITTVVGLIMLFETKASNVK